jgi:hypothetical protein
MGAALGAFAFSASGFFVIHLAHPWGYTTGCWLPWALGLAWTILSEGANVGWRRWLALSIILVLQILPGHFQIAFMTQVTIGLMALCLLVERLSASRAMRPATSMPSVHLSTSSFVRRALLLAGCVAATYPLAGMQVWPTARLARLAAARRDFEYLSGFAETPLHLVHHVAPGLFHRSPLWRRLIWDPFHTSPEEVMAYVGLVPFCLALVAAWRGMRRDSVVRTLSFVAAVTLILSLGPYVPGFRWLIELPGFSFFRAPARWSLITSMMLALLAGKGFDSWREWSRPARMLGIPAIGAIIWIGAVIAVLELALLSGQTRTDTWLSGLFEQVFNARPWNEEVRTSQSKAEPGFREVVAAASKPLDPRSKDPRSFLALRGQIYQEELRETAGVLAALLALAGLCSWSSTRSLLPAGLILLTFADLCLVGRHRLVALAPWRSLVEQSPVLAQLAKEPRGTRVVDGTGNLSMLVGLDPVAAYRTLDLPAVESLTALTRAPLNTEKSLALAKRAMRATGVGVRVLDPVENARVQTGLSEMDSEPLDDPLLTSWMYGPTWGAEQGGWATRFRIIHPGERQHRAWFLPLTALTDATMLDVWNGDPTALLDLFDRSDPVPIVHEPNGTLEVHVRGSGPGWLILSQLADPQWKAYWLDVAEGHIDATILSTFPRRANEIGWQRVWVPSGGHTLRLEYDALDVRQGQALSAASWLAWGLLLLLAKRRRRREPHP